MANRLMTTGASCVAHVVGIVLKAMTSSRAKKIEDHGNAIVEYKAKQSRSVSTTKNAKVVSD